MTPHDFRDVVFSGAILKAVRGRTALPKRFAQNENGASLPCERLRSFMSAASFTLLPDVDIDFPTFHTLQFENAVLHPRVIC